MGWGMVGANYLLQRCCICDSLYFDMQQDHVLKQLNFDLLTQSPGSGGMWVEGGEEWLI